MAKTLIRPADPTDFSLLTAIDAACFPPGVAYEPPDLAWYMKRPGAKTLVLESDGRVAAFLIVNISRDRKSADIITIDVLEEFRRRGFATELLERTEAFLMEKGIATCRLQVDVGNAAAIAFYKRHGFRSIRRLPRYYANGADAWLMTKNFP
jgi:ribosomal-protein-alanine N-acetyltransferase